MKFLLITISSLIFIIILFLIFARNDNGLVYKFASFLLGSEPENGDGAFQFPLGWLILISVGVSLGVVFADFISKRFFST